MELEEKRAAVIFKALGDENRIRILKLLRSGKKCACVLLDDLHITQPTLSHHMKTLCDAGIVLGRKEGKWTHYSISQAGMKTAREYIHALTAADTDERSKPCCEK